MTSGLTGHIIKGYISLTPLVAVLGLCVYPIEAGSFPPASLVSLGHKTVVGGCQRRNSPGDSVTDIE